MRILVTLLLLASGWTQSSTQQNKVLPDGFDFTGSFDCAGTFRAGKVHKATFTGAVILGGKWIELTEEDVEPKTGYLAKYLIGYDPQHKQMVEFDANNFGAVMFTSAEGWVGGTLTMTSPIFADPKASYVANRFLYTVREKDSFEVDWQISRTEKLEWIPSDHLVCKRR